MFKRLTIWLLSAGVWASVSPGALAQSPADREMLTAAPPVAKAVLPYVVALLLAALTALALFRKSKRAGYQQR